MSELDLQTLWQEQPLERPVIHPSRGGAVLASVISLAAVAVLGVWWTSRIAPADRRDRSRSSARRPG